MTGPDTTKTTRPRREDYADRDRGGSHREMDTYRRLEGEDAAEPPAGIESPAS